MKLDTRQGNVFLVVLLIIIAAGLFAVPISYGVLRLYWELDVIPNETRQLANDLKRLAAGQPIPEAAEYSPVPGRHPIVLLDNEGNLIKGPSFLDVAEPDWFARTLGELQLVLILRKVEQEKFGKVSYSKSGSSQGAFDVDDIRVVHHVELIEARNGNVLLREKFVGPTGASEQKSGYGAVVGNPPNWLPWLGSFVLQTADLPNGEHP